MPVLRPPCTDAMRRCAPSRASNCEEVEALDEEPVDADDFEAPEDAEAAEPAVGRKVSLPAPKPTGRA